MNKSIKCISVLLISAILLIFATACSSDNGGSKAAQERVESQIGRIESLQEGGMTLQLGSIEAKGNTDAPDATVEDFVPENKAVELTLDKAVSATEGEYQVGDVVSVNYNNNNVVDNIKLVASCHHPHTGAMSGSREFARVDSIENGKITLTIGTITHSPNDQDQNLDAQRHLSAEFAPTGEVKTLTIKNGTDLNGVKPGDIVAFWCDADNTLEKIHVPYGYVSARTFGRIESIDGNTVTLLLGTVDPNARGAALTESFSPGTETVTLTAPDPSILAGLNAGDVVVVHYNDENQIEQIHVPGSGQGQGSGHGHGQGHHGGVDR